MIVTEETERVTPSEPAKLPAVVGEPARRYDRVVTFGLAGAGDIFRRLAHGRCGGWISSAFDRSTVLGILAATAIAAGLAGAGAVIGRELTSLFRLKSVEAIHERLSGNPERIPPAEARKAIADILAVVPRDREMNSAIATFQRQVQLIIPCDSRSRFCRVR